MGSKEEVRARLDIADVIGEHVRLVPAGRQRYKALCPFHAEKTPSFHVDAEQGYYYCFGCKAGGDVFNFVQEIEQLSFGDALRKLATRAGVTLETQHERREAGPDLYAVNEFALRHFKDALRAPGGAAAREYLQARGLTGRIAADFELGYAPPGWDGLLGWAKTRGVAPELLQRAGLLSESGESGRVYDRFRDRVMFPIRDHLGRLVGFGGRVLGDGKPKYLNTPETDIFKKGDVLYGLPRARAAGADELVVVEGYLDVIAMHQHGFGQAVATLGTALTAEHASLIARLGVSRLTLLFDRDEAGQRATLGGLDHTLGRRFRVRVAALPGDKDPADTLARGGTEELRAALGQGIDEAHFRVQAAVETHGLDPAGKRRVLHDLLPRLSSEDPLDEGATRLRALVCETLDIREEALLDWVGSKARRRELSPTQLAGMSRQETDHELKFLQQVLLAPDLLGKLDGELPWRNPAVRKVLLAARGASSPAEVLELFRGQPEERMIMELLFQGRESQALSRSNQERFEERLGTYAREAAGDVLHRLNLRELRGEAARLRAELEGCSAEQQRELLGQLSALQRAIEAEKRLKSQG